MLHLASQSPRRRQLLELLGYDFGVLDIDLAEVRGAHESPLDYVSRVSREKAGAGLLQVAAIPDAHVLGADTEVILGDIVFGKPADAADARRMLRQLSGLTHTVISSVWLLDAGRERQAISTSQVTIAALDDATIDTYVASGEPMGKAGAYAIQGRGAALVEHLAGSHSGVMGLPMFETAALLRDFGVRPRD